MEYLGVTGMIGCAVLAVVAYNSGLAIYNLWGDAASVAFVLVADAVILLQFLGVHLQESERARGWVGRGRIKRAVWALSTLLTAMFALKVAPLVPPHVAASLLLMVISTAAGGFSAFFLN
ncbi:unnamed protein product [Urochloa decumbens]|uniref:Uncharacterized protein n=1 Tax=Urochloa decumbens TaxID=240449 RepID=A0ABC9DUH9_9POAL